MTTASPIPNEASVCYRSRRSHRGTSERAGRAHQTRGSPMARQMKLGLSMRGIGYHAAAWRHPDVPPGAALDYNYYLRNAQAAERGQFDQVFFADGIGIRRRGIPEGAV